MAHDLKAPLTGVGSWAEILGDQLDALERRRDATRARACVASRPRPHRMEQLISDLLAYSQAQSATLAPESLSLTGMVEAVARELARGAAPARAPVIEHGAAGPACCADRTLVGQLLDQRDRQRGEVRRPGHDAARVDRQ